MINQAKALQVDHYENFPVASWLCPRHLRFPVSVIYHFARTADDLADEGPSSAAQRLIDLSEFRSDLNHCLSDANNTSAASGLEKSYLERSKWPQIFKPLGTVLREYQIPSALLFLLLDAFEQDVMYSHHERRYKSREELIAYCQKSAAPIGRIMMHLFGESKPDDLLKSDSICCALQLINFWQDISLDIPRKRFYLPEGSSIEDEINFAKKLMQNGASLALSVPGRAGWELRFVVQGGMRIIDKLERSNPLKKRPKITRLDYALIAWRCLFKKHFVAH